MIFTHKKRNDKKTPLKLLYFQGKKHVCVVIQYNISFFQISHTTTVFYRATLQNFNIERYCFMIFLTTLSIFAPSNKLHGKFFCLFIWLYFRLHVFCFILRLLKDRLKMTAIMCIKGIFIEENKRQSMSPVLFYSKEVLIKLSRLLPIVKKLVDSKHLQSPI